MYRTLQLVVFLFPFATPAVPTAAAQVAYPGYPVAPWAYAAPESGLRITVTPSDARVYVDGYLAGRVDEFDGQLQRLRLIPGQHEIAIYLEGYRTLRQRLYLGPNTTRRMEGTLEPLGPGEPNDPIPEPVEQPVIQEPQEPPTFTQRVPPPQAPPPQSAPPPQAGGRDPRVTITPETPTRYASLSFRIAPARSTIRVDGQEFRSGSRKEHLIIQVLEGQHTIRVERNGYEPFTIEVDADAGETVPLNITLTPR